MSLKDFIKWEAPASALAKWQPEIRAKEKPEEDSQVSINIYSTIGDYGYGDGMTAKIMDSILRKAEGRDVVVNINSPGGDFFEGVTQYNLLKNYEGKVTVRVLGIAASAASIVAMAGDDIEISKGGFFMIHNAWSLVIGNKNAMMEAYKVFKKFDESMAGIYVDRTGLDEKDVVKMMDAESYLNASESIEKGFASALIGEDEIDIEESQVSSYYAAVKQVDLLLAKGGTPRSERRRLIKNLKGTHDAAEDTPATHDAGFVQALESLLKTIKP